ncbi:MAG: hypothetical protein CMH83_09310 [Nocardioides sp.]|nr:hypothetical protein [Nocardioides sp.]
MLNLAGRVTVDQLQLPIFLDMVGTAVAAVVLGPWWGVSVGLSTNLVGVATSGPLSIPFAAVNVAGALVWGYGVHRWGLGRTIPRYFMLNVLAGTVCSLVATPIIVAVSVDTGHVADLSVQRLLPVTHLLAVSVFLTNLVVSLADKMVCGFVALAVAEAVPRPWRTRDGGRRRPERPAPSVPGLGPTP